MTLYELIKDGSDRDCMIFDSESNIISKRLLCLMISTAIKKEIVPTDIYVDSLEIPEIMAWFSINDVHVWPNKDDNNYTMYGYKINFVDGLSHDSDDGDYLDFFIKLGGEKAFPPIFLSKHCKKSIVVLASKTQAILGCY